jgi:hypothetical protein
MDSLGPLMLGLVLIAFLVALADPPLPLAWLRARGELGSFVRTARAGGDPLRELHHRASGWCREA